MQFMTKCKLLLTKDPVLFHPGTSQNPAVFFISVAYGIYFYPERATSEHFFE